MLMIRALGIRGKPVLIIPFSGGGVIIGSARLVTTSFKDCTECLYINLKSGKGFCLYSKNINVEIAKLFEKYNEIKKCGGGL
jgi:hypothetical protein